MATVALILALTGVGLGWIPFLYAVGAVAAVAGAVFGFIALKRIKAGTERGKPAALWAIGLLPVAIAVVAFGSWFTSRTLNAFDRYNNPPAHELTIGRCQAAGDQIEFGGTLQNLSDAPSDFNVAIAMESASGRRFSRRIKLADVAPKESRPWNASTELLGGNVTCRVTKVFGPSP